MKHYFYFILSIIFFSCSKADKDIPSPYSPEQQRVLSTFNGVFKSKVGTIYFLNTFKAPIDYIYELPYDETTKVSCFGTSNFKYEHGLGDIQEQVYYISNDGKYITFYDVYPNKNIHSPEKIKITVVSDIELKFYYPYGENAFNPIPVIYTKVEN